MNEDEAAKDSLNSRKQSCNGEHKQDTSNLQKEKSGLSLEKGQQHSAKKQLDNEFLNDEKCCDNNDLVKHENSDEYLGKVSFFNSKFKNRTVGYYICVTLVWILALGSRLYDIENPPKVW